MVRLVVSVTVMDNRPVRAAAGDGVEAQVLQLAGFVTERLQFFGCVNFTYPFRCLLVKPVQKRTQRSTITNMALRAP